MLALRRQPVEPLGDRPETRGADPTSGPPTSSLDEAPPHVGRVCPAPPRVGGLDAFRGLTIVLMVLVRNPGDVQHSHALLRHAPWHGCTLADLVFPFFIFIVGASLPLSLRDHARASSKELVARFASRAFIFVALGAVLNLDFTKPALQLTSVLGRIGLCLLLAMPFALRACSRTIAAVISALLLAYWVVLVVVPAPTVAHVDAEGQVDEVPREQVIARAAEPLAFSKEGSLPAYVDRKLFPVRAHAEYDPEGLLGTLPALATMLLGLLAGRALGNGPAVAAPALRMVTIGAGLALFGLAWAQVVPLNKAIWTPSFVALTGGLALLLLGALVLLIDSAGWRRPFSWLQVYGSNALLIYVLSTVLQKITRADAIVTPSLRARSFAALEAVGLAAPHGSLVHAALHALLWLGVAALLYRRRWFLRI